MTAPPEHHIAQDALANFLQSLDPSYGLAGLAIVMSACSLVYARRCYEMSRMHPVSTSDSIRSWGPASDS